MTGYYLALVAGVMAVSLEYVYSRASNYSAIFLYTTPFQCLLGYVLYRMIHLSGGIMEAFVLFSGTTLTLRLALRFISAQEVGTGLWIAYGLIVMAQVVKHVWR
jgi:hypothetical protein